MKKKRTFIIAFIIAFIVLVGTFYIINKDKIHYYCDVHFKKEIDITKYPFYASGNGIDNDTWAIQEAIDTLFSNGGGTVILHKDHSFLSTTIVMKDNITLLIDEGATLIQSNKQDEYVNYNGNTEIEYAPVYGHNITDYNMWDHSWYLNPPFIYVPEGVENIKITGNGKIKMADNKECDNVLHITSIGLFKTNNFEISNISIEGYNAYACMLMNCKNGIVKNIKINNPQCENNDGIMLMNCNDLRITGCDLNTGDDGIYIFSSYKDPRKSFWWNSDEAISSKNIEIDHNKCSVTNNKCKAFGLILWSNEIKDVSISDINIHDNYFETVGIWDESTNPFITNNNEVNIQNIYWNNNDVDQIQDSFNRLNNILKQQ